MTELLQALLEDLCLAETRRRPHHDLAPGYILLALSRQGPSTSVGLSLSHTNDSSDPWFEIFSGAKATDPFRFRPPSSSLVMASLVLAAGAGAERRSAEVRRASPLHVPCSPCSKTTSVPHGPCSEARCCTDPHCGTGDWCEARRRERELSRTCSAPITQLECDGTGVFVADSRSLPAKQGIGMLGQSPVCRTCSSGHVRNFHDSMTISGSVTAKHVR